MKKYYEAYEERYKKIHAETGLAWAGEKPSPTILKLLKKYNASKDSTILDLGCGEGQNALYVMKHKYNVEGCDISKEAIEWCKNKAREKKLNENNFFVMDILKNNLKKKYDFIYSVAVLHMLVEEKDRLKFLVFIRKHLKENGKAFIIVMGDGKEERRSDTTKAFDLADRPFGDSIVKVATTSCRMVNWEKLLEEMDKANLKVLNYYNDKTISGFVNSMIVEVENY